MLRSYHLLLLSLVCDGHLASAMQNPFMVVPFLAATTTSEYYSIPTVALDLQVDLQLSRNPSAPKPPKPMKPKKKKKVAVTKKVPPPKEKLKNLPKEAQKNDPPNAVAVVSPPQPPAPKVEEAKPKAPFSKRKSPQPSLAKRIAEHKYLSVVWATLAFVWTPLLIILLVHTFLGKEPFIALLVKLLPEDSPTEYIERAVDDSLWVRVTGVAGIATIGTLVVEMLRLAIGTSFSDAFKAEKD